MLSTALIGLATWAEVPVKSRRISPPRLSNASLSSALLAVFQWLATRVRRFAVCGFSLGAGLTLSTLARHQRALPEGLEAAVAVCPPLDMSRSADALELRRNWLYSRRFTRSLCRSYGNRQRLSSKRYQPGLERGITTLRQFDEIITARYGGFDNAEHYYSYASAGPRLTDIVVPTLVLSSQNDPFIPASSVSPWPRSTAVSLEMIEDAGHLGFVGTSHSPRFFWAADRALGFFNEIDSLLTVS